MLYCCTIAKILNLNWINIFQRIRFLPPDAREEKTVQEMVEQNEVSNNVRHLVAMFSYYQITLRQNLRLGVKIHWISLYLSHLSTFPGTAADEAEHSCTSHIPSHWPECKPDMFSAKLLDKNQTCLKSLEASPVRGTLTKILFSPSSFPSSS